MASTQRSANGDVVNYGPASSSGQSNIVVARDVQGENGAHRLSGLEQMTPTEREPYYRELRLTHPNPIVPFYRYHDRSRP